MVAKTLMYQSIYPELKNRSSENMKKRVGEFIKNVHQLSHSNLLILLLWKMITTKPGDIISNIGMSRILTSLLDLNPFCISLITTLASISPRDRENKLNIWLRNPKC